MMDQLHPPVLTFQDEYRFLSNFWPSPFVWAGEKWPTAEHAYQAAKFEDRNIREIIRGLDSAGKAKNAPSLFAGASMIPNWKTGPGPLAMSEIVAAKFTQNPGLRNLLQRTHGRLLIEGNTWHDNFWGSCRCREEDCVEPGNNRLGLILMATRETLLRTF